MSETEYIVRLPGLTLKTGAEAVPGGVHRQAEFRMSNYTFDKRIKQEWLKVIERVELPENSPVESVPVVAPVEEEPEPEPEPEPEVVGETGPTRYFPDIGELEINPYWKEAKKPEGYKKYRICPHCKQVCESKSELFDCDHEPRGEEDTEIDG